MSVYAQDTENNVKVDISSINPPSNILETLNISHYRLFVKSLRDFELLKKKVSGDVFLSKSSIELSKKADILSTLPPAVYYLVFQLEGKLLETSHAVYHRIYLLTMDYKLTGDKRYLDCARNKLLAALKFLDWNTHYFLDTSEMVHEFAIGYDWLYDVWTPEQRKVMRKAMTNKDLICDITGYSMKTNHLIDGFSKSSEYFLAMADTYFDVESGKRCTYYRLNSEGHNILV